MSAERVCETLQQYVEVLLARGDYGRFFDDDIEFALMGTDQRMRGAEAAEQAIRFLHETAFDAEPELSNLLVGDHGAAAEAFFVGTHTAISRALAQPAIPSAFRTRSSTTSTSKSTRSRRCGSTCQWTSSSARSAARPKQKWLAPRDEKRGGH